MFFFWFQSRPIPHNPPGMILFICEMSNNLGGTNAWYIGPALRRYRCVICCVLCNNDAFYLLFLATTATSPTYRKVAEVTIRRSSWSPKIQHQGIGFSRLVLATIPISCPLYSIGIITVQFAIMVGEASIRKNWNIGVMQRHSTQPKSSNKSSRYILKRSETTGRCVAASLSRLMRQGTVKSSTDFRNAPVLWCTHWYFNLTTSCDGYGETNKFDVDHALDWIKGGSVTARHDEDKFRYQVSHLLRSPHIRCIVVIDSAPIRLCFLEVRRRTGAVGKEGQT